MEESSEGRVDQLNSKKIARDSKKGRLMQKVAITNNEEILNSEEIIEGATASESLINNLARLKIKKLSSKLSSIRNSSDYDNEIDKSIE